MQRKPLPRPPRDNEQVSEYVTAVRRGLDSHFVVPSDGKWSVRRPKAARASGVFSTKAEALAHARKVLARQKTELFVFIKMVVCHASSQDCLVQDLSDQQVHHFS